MREGGRRGHQGCGYDARAQPRAARGMPRSEGRRPASDGADVAQRRESVFLFWPLLSLPKMEVASRVRVQQVKSSQEEDIWTSF